MPSHTPEERARNAPIRARQRRRNAEKAGLKFEKSGNAPRSRLREFGASIGAALRFVGPRQSVAMSAKQAKGILAPRNSPPMSTFEKTGGISGRHNTDHNTDHG